MNILHVQGSACTSSQGKPWHPQESSHWKHWESVRRDIRTNTNEFTYYASRLCISVIAGTVLALENGFHLLIRSHQPDTESPKFRGELSSIYSEVVGFQYCIYCEIRTDPTSEANTAEAPMETIAATCTNHRLLHENERTHMHKDYELVDYQLRRDVRLMVFRDM